ncbi:MAG: hypothetical protein NW201_14270 [Gemmatimonadales bacterium]|nr:hypothetical protein [Gemmatimonadales bacterium]
MTARRTAPALEALATVAAAAAALSCYDPGIATRPIPAPLVLRLPAASPPADSAGTDTVTITKAAVDPEAAPTITITVAGATLVSPTTARLRDTVHAIIRRPALPGAADIRVAAAGIEQTAVLRYVPALAESAEVQPEQFRLEAALGASMRITARLRRAVGTPSAGRPVQFRARAEDGRIVGFMSPASAASAADGTASARFVLDSAAYRGPLIVEIATPGPSDSVRAQVRLFVVGAP